MAKDMQIAFLLDFYGEMLTEKQRELTELYYDQDLSLGEIADEYHISRQGVRDNIKRAEASLLEFEEKLGLVKRFQALEPAIDRIVAQAEEITRLLGDYPENRQAVLRAEEIIRTARQLRE